MSDKSCAKDTSVIAVQGILQSYGFDVEPIPKSQKGKRADLRVNTGDDSYVIEVKSRLDHPRLRTRINEKPDGEVVPYSKSLSPDNTFCGIIREAVEQLESTPKKPQEFNCLWFRAIEWLITDAAILMETTLYGISYLMIRDEQGNIFHKQCYLFHYNEFFGHPNLDGVIIETNNGLKLCVNMFSAKDNDFKESELGLFFGKKNAVIDPNDLERKGLIYLADTDVHRRDQEKVKQYVQSKYGIKVTNFFSMELTAGIVTATVPAEVPVSKSN